MAWPMRVKIYWDPEHDVPLLMPSQGSSSSTLFMLKLTDPGDARPATQIDHIRLREALSYEFGSNEIYTRLFMNKFILLNKVPHWDLMWEIISSGNVLGQLYYDPFKYKWRFRLNYTGSVLVLREGLVDHVTASGLIIEKGVLKSCYSGNLRQVVIVGKNGRPRGIAENIDGKLVVAKLFRAFIEPMETSRRSSSLHDVLKLNEYALYYFESRAKAFIYSMHSKTGKEVIVSYSGGKDSLVSLHLAMSTIGELKLLFNDTGLELPETIANVEEVSEKYGFTKVLASAGNRFWNDVELFGPPGRDYRWCCKVLKLIPLAKVSRQEWPNGALNIVGQRAFESLERAKSHRVWRNKWIPHLLSISPIQEWSQLHVWLYIHKHKLPYNKLYDKGFERLGCYLCPASTLAEFKEVETVCPELWSKWISVLEVWRDKLNQPREWIDLGLWRWLTPAFAKRRLELKISSYSSNWKKEYVSRLIEGVMRLSPIKIDRGEHNLVAYFNEELLNDECLLTFASNVKMLKANTYRDVEGLIIETDRTKVVISGRTIKALFRKHNGVEDLVDVLKNIYRVRGCVKCGSCVIWCPEKVVKLTSNGPLPRVPCSSCRICIENCPISEMLVEKIVVPLILDDVTAWRRRTRFKREDLLKSFRTMGYIP
ncbi:MAG: phosphoadenosine phosphosulfate reductase family protein [Sulfolobales archaeon]|nr:phosphoadenosine phosphosulfate reductase family protein [Sulfolobales archaeon]